MKLFKKHTREKVMAIVFLLIIFGMLFGMLITCGAEVGENFIITYRTEVPTGAPILERIVGAIDAMETAVNEGAFHRQDFVEMYGLAQLAMNKKVITDYNYGSLYKTNYGQTTFAVIDRYVPESYMATYDLVNALRQDDIPFLYIQLPFKIPGEEYGGKEQLPENIKDNSNINADNYVWGLDVAGVDTYDLRDDFWNSGMTQNELFFDTDHHWTIEGAFMTTGLIADFLNENYDIGIPEDLYTEENFNFDTYEDYFLGSMGRRVGKIYGGIDDFTLITPKFDTDIRLEQIEGMGYAEFEGTFEEAVLEMEYITDPDIKTNRYAVYHGDYQELRFTNNLAENDSKILIIKDSFGIPVYSFLSLGVHEVRAIDMRLFEKNVAQYAAEYDPDLVIVMYNADSFVYPMFDFNPDVNNEDFEY
ncbi:MAG: hypothetical protein IJC14_06085 [Firmicutes bacterium]|nr:hypothetical protein [Bacillota bacterium]